MDNVDIYKNDGEVENIDPFEGEDFFKFNENVEEDNEHPDHEEFGYTHEF